MKLFVVPGHGAGDPGAGGFNGAGKWFDEAERVRVLATRIKELGGDSVVLADFNRNFYAENLWQTYPVPSDWKCLELHMDAAGGGARGAHVIIADGVGGPDQEDKNIAQFITELFPGRDVKINESNWYQNTRVAGNRGINYRLVENGFIDNPNDLDKFNAHIDDIALGYLKAFGIAPIVGTGTATDATISPAPVVSDAACPAGMWRCVTAHDGSRWCVAADGPHEIKSDAEWWAMVGMLGKPADGSGTIKAESLQAIRDVLAR